MFNKSQLLKLFETGKMGTAIVEALVKESHVRKSDKSVLQSITLSYASKLLEPKEHHKADLIAWMQACCLASYQLGKADIFREDSKENSETNKETTKPRN